MKPLNVYRLEPFDHLVQPREFTDLDEQSPALSLMTDYRIHKPYTIDADVAAVGVAKLMAMEGASCKLVVNKRQEFVGLLTTERLSEQHILVAQTLQGVDRSEVSASDMMLPRNAVPALDYEALKSATIGDLVQALRESGETHCLVLDRDQHHIRGVISVDDIIDRLHRDVPIAPKRSIAQALTS